MTGNVQQSLRVNRVGSPVFPTSTFHRLKALATLVLAYNPRAAFNSGPALSPSALHRAASGRRISDVRLQEQQDWQDSCEEDLPPDMQARIDELKEWDERSVRCAERIKGMPIYIVGMGRRKDYMGAYMGQRYFWKLKTTINIPAMTLQLFPAVAEDFKYSDAENPNITECLDRDVELVELVHREVLYKTKGATDHIIVCGDSTGDDESWEFMRKQNGIIVRILWECDPDAYDDVWLPKKDKYETYNRWNASHCQGADIVLDIRDHNEECFRPDIHGINLVDQIMEWMDRKEACAGGILKRGEEELKAV